MLRDHALQAELAGMPEQIRPDVALFERREVDAVYAAREQPGQISLAQAPFLNWLDGLKPDEWERNRNYKKRT
jgi:hypothetical protein